MNDQKFKRQVEEIECPNCGGFGAVHSIFRLNRTTVRHSIHCKWCDYSDWWNEEQDEACEKEQKGVKMETISYKEFIEKVYGILKKHAITGSRLTISDGGRRLEIVFDIGNIAEIRIIVWLLRDKDSNYWEPAIEYNCALGFRSGMDPITTLQVIDINRAIEELVDTLSHCRMDYSVITSTSNYRQYEWGKVKEQK